MRNSTKLLINGSVIGWALMLWIFIIFYIGLSLVNGLWFKAGLGFVVYVLIRCYVVNEKAFDRLLADELVKSKKKKKNKCK